MARPCCQRGPLPPVGCGKLARSNRARGPAVTSPEMQKILRQIAAELRVAGSQVRAAVDLLDGGATVPFIARYRKEATGGLDDVQHRELEARLSYLRGRGDGRDAGRRGGGERGK